MKLNPQSDNLVAVVRGWEKVKTFEWAVKHFMIIYFCNIIHLYVYCLLICQST